MHLRSPAEKIGRYKLTTTAVLLLLALSVYAGFLMAEHGYYYWSPFFGSQSSSAIFFSLVFVGVASQLAKRSVSDLETFSIALATMLSAIWLYELIYRCSLIAFNYLRDPFFEFSDTSSVLLNGALSLLVVVGHKYIRVKSNRLFWSFVLIFVILYASWVLIGFPRYDGTFQLPRLIEVGDPFLIGFLLSRFSKLSLCISWVLLYSKRH